MRLFIAVLAFAFTFNVNAQDDRFKGLNKKELKDLILDVEEQNRIQVKDLAETIDTCSQHIIELDLFLNKTQSTLDSTLEQLSERDKYILDIHSAAAITQHEIDSLRKVFLALNNPELLSKINYYTSSWNSMCYLEKIVALLGEDYDWYTAILPELKLTDDQYAVLHSLHADDYGNLPIGGGGGACTGGVTHTVYRLDDDWCVSLGKYYGDWESSAYISIALMSTKLQVAPILSSVTDVSEIYVSDDCNLLVARHNVNPCWGNGLTYNLLYFDDNLFGALEVNCGGDEDGFNSPTLPFYNRQMELTKTNNTIALTAFDYEAEWRLGEYLDIFKLTKVSGELSQNSLFNLDVFEQRVKSEFTFLKKLSKL